MQEGRLSRVSRKKDMILVLALLVLALLFLLISRPARKPAAVPPAPPPAETGTVTEERPAESSYADFVSETVRAYFEEYPAASYLFVNTGGSAYSPIPLNGDNSFRIAQQDGSENVIHIGENSFYMESSNCKNQNCVGQGEVTLENRESRPLFNMVICLPHNLSLELLTREEAEARLLEMYAKDPPPAA